MKSRIALRECLVISIMIVGALLFLYGKEHEDVAVTAVKMFQRQQPKESRGKIALTFDDGPHPVYTEPILEGLRKRGVKATFFVMGKNVEAYPELVEEMYEDGHLIGNHTYSHLQLNHSNVEQFKQELVRTNELILEVTGQNPAYVRPPFGSWEKQFEDELNMFPVLWTIDPKDWCSSNADCVARSVIANARENDIILMHDQYPSTVTAAMRIVDSLLEQGYDFVTVDEILFD